MKIHFPPWGFHTLTLNSTSLLVYTQFWLGSMMASRGLPEKLLRPGITFRLRRLPPSTRYCSALTLCSTSNHWGTVAYTWDPDLTAPLHSHLFKTESSPSSQESCCELHFLPSALFLHLVSCFTLRAPTYANCFVSFIVSPFSSLKLACDSSSSLATWLDLELPRRLVFHLDLNIALWREVHVTQKANGTNQGSEASLSVQNSQIPSRLHEQ